MPADAAVSSWVDTLQALLASARGLVDDLLRDPLLQRLLRAFVMLPEADREPIVKVLERDASWRRIVAETAEASGIDVRPNPHASLYLHVVDEHGPSPRDLAVIGLGIERFVQLLPLVFQEGVHAQWVASAHDLIRRAGPELRALGARLAHEVLELIAAVEAESAR